MRTERTPRPLPPPHHNLHYPPQPFLTSRHAQRLSEPRDGAALFGQVPAAVKQATHAARELGGEFFAGFGHQDAHEQRSFPGAEATARGVGRLRTLPGRAKAGSREQQAIG